MSDFKNNNTKIYHELDKQELLMEAQCFNSRNVNPQECEQVLTKLIYFLDKGNSFTEDEMSNLFFSITKLFSSDDKNLKRLLFLSIKYLKESPFLCMITNCITRDVKSDKPEIKSNALRLLPLILEGQHPMQLQQDLKMSLISKNENVIESALIACLEINKTLPDVIKKCQEEFMQILLSQKYTNSHYKAFILIKIITQNDQITFQKILLQMIKKNQDYNEITLVYLLKVLGQMIQSQKETLDQNFQFQSLKFIREMCEESNSIGIEACRVICQFNHIDNQTLKPIVENIILQRLELSNQIVQFSYLKILNSLVQNSTRLSLFKEPAQQLQDLMSGENKNITAQIIAILIKTTPVEKAKELLNKITQYLDILPENLQEEVIKNCLYFTQKNQDTFSFVFDFLKLCLKTKGQSTFKISIINVMEKLLHSFPQNSDQILKHLVLYIEDSYDEQITLEILEIFTNHFSKSENISFYMKYLLNRLVLDTTNVRVATITTLGQNSLINNEIKEQTIPLFKSLLNDSDEEVVGRAQQYLNYFQQENQNQKEVVFSEESVTRLLHQLETNFTQQNYNLNFINFDDLKSQKISQNQQKEAVVESSPVEHIESLIGYSGQNKRIDEETQNFIENESSMKQFGKILITQKWEKLSDQDSEIYIQMRKHIFEDNLTLEFSIQNNSENELQKMKIELDYDSEQGLEVIDQVSQHSIIPSAIGKIYVNMSKSFYLINSNFQGILNFEAVVKEDDEILNTYEDEFPLEEFEVKISDFFNSYPFIVDIKNFQELWDHLEDAKIQQSNYQFKYETIVQAMEELQKLFGFNICMECSDIDLNKNFHQCYLMGLYNNQIPVLIDSKIGFDKDKNCIISLQVKSKDEDLSEQLLDI